ncbi:hypothetical protein GCM10009850_007320 [Nonomuraea monospora]|uniref:Transposase n=1 Tax=Nonomuraea monospora TaxID=568818 RepID=A0ABN3C7K3_9ACTN
MSGPEIRKILEEIMASTAWPVYSPFAREHFGRGREEGREEGKIKEAAEAVLLVLASRGFNIPDSIHTMITSTKDLTQLHDWITRAVNAPTLQDLFGKPAEQGEE